MQFLRSEDQNDSGSHPGLPAQPGSNQTQTPNHGKIQAEEKHFSSLVEELKTSCGKDFFGFEPDTMEKIIIDHLIQKQESLSIAESCTGGLITHLLTQIPGSSQVLRGSMVTYQTELKTLELQIPESRIRENGVVSEKTAVAMAEAIRKRWKTTYGMSSTGYLGPTGGDAFAKVGTVWVAVATPDKTVAKSLQLENHRERNKERSAQGALDPSAAFSNTVFPGDKKRSAKIWRHKIRIVSDAFFSFNN